MKIKNKKKFNQILLGIDAIFCLIFTLTMMLLNLHHNIFVVCIGFLPLSIINVYLLGWKYIQRAYFEVFAWKRIGMNFLIFLSTQLSIFFTIIQLIIKATNNNIKDSNFEFSSLLEVAMFVIIFVKIGDEINSLIKVKIGSDLKAIQTIQPQYAYVNHNNEFTKIPINQVKKGDIIKVLSNDIVPMDGFLKSKSAIFDSQIINGENTGLKTSYKDNVVAGMRNLGGDVLIESTSTVNDNLINELVRKIQKIQTEKSAMQSIVDRILYFFTPIVIFLAVIAFILSFFVFNKTADERILKSFQFLISVLVSACPCAIGIAIPLAILIGSSRAAKKGVIFNKPDAFSKLNKISTVAFDKTGTLTIGEVAMIEYYGDKEYLSLIGAFESNIKHPIASGILAHLNELKINYEKPIKNINKELMTFNYLNDYYEIIKYSSFKTVGSEPEINLHQTKNTSSLLFKNGNLVAQMIFDDKLRDGIKEKIQELQEMGYKITMITGDNFETATKVGKKLQIDKIYANVTPEKKMLIIKEMQMSGEKVLFVGDGFNDVLAINQADLSIAIISKSTYLNLKADITLLDSNISLISEVVKDVKYTKKIIYTNLIWAFTYNLIVIPLAVFGIIFPMLGMLMMFCSTILVLLNSLYFKIKK